MPSRRPYLVAAFVVVCVVWGSTYLGIRIALESGPPFLLGALRFVVAGAALFAVARWRGEPMPSAVQWRSSIVTGILFFVIGNGLVNVAEQSVSSGLASVLVATMPLWTTVFARLAGTRSSPGEMVGVLLGLVGVVILNLGGELRASPVGGLCALLAPMGWALGSVASQRLPLPGGVMRTATQMLAGGVAMYFVSLALHETFVAWSVRSAVAVAYLCVFGSLIGFTAYSYLLSHTRPAVATSYAYVNPVIAVALGVLLAGERFGITSAAGAVVILAAVALVQKRRTDAPQQASQPAPAADRTAGLAGARDPAR